MNVRAVVVLGATWAVAVVGSAAITWGVIDVAGRQVLDDSAVPTVATSSTANQAARPRQRHRPSPPASTAKPGPKTPGTAGPTATPTRSPAVSPSPHTPTASGGPRPGQFTHEGPHPSPDASPTATPNLPPDPETWTGAAGTLTVSCQQGRARLQGATPADGYRVEVEQEDDAVVAQFEREHPEDEVHVRATCVNGRPQFDVEDDRTEGRPEQDLPG